jgi:peptidoglycan hydrolase-like protein with peptidoglycan-binding domain
MIRALTLASALMAASLSANTLAAQSSSTTTSAKPAMHQAPAGHVNTDTTAKTGTKTSAASKAAPAHHAAWTSAQVKEAQVGLAKAGLYKGKATGVLDKETQSALRAYQKRNKLPVTGQLSDSTLAKLKSA